MVHLNKKEKYTCSFYFPMKNVMGQGLDGSVDKGLLLKYAKFRLLCRITGPMESQSK